jgi:hypothetical protein
MVSVFDPTYFDGTIFSLDETKETMADGWDEFFEAIPASFFPKTLTFDGASGALPNMFHTGRNIMVFSERARLIVERWAPGQVEFIPVACRAAPRLAARLNFDTAYYFINVLGRAQRLQWPEMPAQQLPPLPDGTVLFILLPDFRKWKLRERAAGEPLIWRDEPWIVGSKRYSGHSRIFVEDVLWRELDANFPDQLNALRVGE